ncbi:HCO3 transporter family-domain-containing protein [Aspergillus undulatus]|uniref:HCO3 transporter family-domain-containing protein n=1 Tax=Aspergillus undulatus TaxID=1810928 RepID=UPI003CCD9D2C
MLLMSAFCPRSTRVSSHPPGSQPRQRRGREPSIHENEETERDDAHSIITPSKHTPKVFRAIKRAVASGGPLRPFRLFKQDILNIHRCYATDWFIFNQLIFASAVYVFLTNLLPGITFASDLYNLTGKICGAIEVMLITGLCGVIFSIFSIQSLTILGVTGPFAVLAENIYELCRDDFKIPFLPFMAWSLIHAAWLHYLLAIVNSHDWTMRYVTTFTTDVFSLLNTRERAHANLKFAVFLYAVIGAVRTMLVAISFSTAESWQPLFHHNIRLGLSEYAAAISIILLVYRIDSFEPSSPERTKMVVGFWELPAQWVFAAVVPGLIITPGGFAWDIVLLGTTTALCGIPGSPPANGLLPQAPLHSESLMHSEFDQRTIIVDGEEKRFSTPELFSYFVSPPFMKVLGLTPTSVLAGLFLFMAKLTIASPILYRTFYLLTPPSELPLYHLLSQNPTGTPHPVPTIARHAHPICHPGLPLLIVALVPFRLLLMKCWWPREAPRSVDAWACKEVTPGDDEDVEDRTKGTGSEPSPAVAGGASSGGDDMAADWVEVDDIQVHRDEELGRT